MSHEHIYGISETKKYLAGTEFKLGPDGKTILIKHYVDPNTGETFEERHYVSSEEALANGYVAKESLLRKKNHSVVKW